MANMYIDECKEGRYIFAAIIVEEHAGPRLRKALRQHVESGRNIHFSKEKDSRKKQLLAEFESLGFRAVVFCVDGKQNFETRKGCIDQALKFASENSISKVTFETDESILKLEKLYVADYLRTNGLNETLGFDHRKKHEEPLLWVSDAIAWCVFRGGDWERRIAGILARGKSS